MRVVPTPAASPQVNDGLRLGSELLSLQQPAREHAGLLAFLEQLAPMITT